MQSRCMTRSCCGCAVWHQHPARRAGPSCPLCLLKTLFMAGWLSTQNRINLCYWSAACTGEANFCSLDLPLLADMVILMSFHGLHALQKEPFDRCWKCGMTPRGHSGCGLMWLTAKTVNCASEMWPLKDELLLAHNCFNTTLNSFTSLFQRITLTVT